MAFGGGPFASVPFAGLSPSAQYSKTLTASEVMAATLTIGKGVHLPVALMTELASITRSYGKLLKPSINVAATLGKNINYLKLNAAIVTESASMIFGKAYFVALSAGMSYNALSIRRDQVKALSTSNLMAGILVRNTTRNLNTVMAYSAVGGRLHAYQVTLSASESFSPTLTKSPPTHILTASAISELAALSVGKVKPMELDANYMMVLASLAYSRFKPLNSSMSISAALSTQSRRARELDASITETALPLKARVINIVVAPIIITPSINARISKSLVAPIVMVAGMNKRGRYPMPPAVLELFDLVDPYRLPALKGATVGYVHGILGSGVQFDIYAAVQLALQMNAPATDTSFFVVDNGLKVALDQHPALARVM